MLSFIVSGSIFFVSQGITKAAVWPGDQWGAGTDMEIFLSQNKNHKGDQGTKVKFGYYAKNNGGSKVIKFVRTKCGDKHDTSAAATSINRINNPLVFKNGDCGDKEMNIGGTPSDIVTLNDGNTYFRYDVTVTLDAGDRPEDDDPWNRPTAGFHFNINYDDNGGNNFVGYLQSESKSLPINSRRNANEKYLPDIKIKINCSVSGNQAIQFYDSDNNKDLYAQPVESYKPVKFKITNSNFSRILSDNKLDGWGESINGFWWPIDTRSSSIRRAVITMIPGNDNRYFTIRDLGQGNYTVLDFKFDETPVNCNNPCPPPNQNLFYSNCPTPLPPPSFNWAVEPKTTVDKTIAIKGETAIFKSEQNRATGSDGWMSDESTTDLVKANIITTFNGNIISQEGFDTPSGGSVYKPAVTKIQTLSETGEYCQYINYPVGFLGKRKKVGHSNDHTYRWVFIPEKKPNTTIAAGGYEQWWLASTTDDSPEVNTNNQYWAFHDTDDPWGADEQQYNEVITTDADGKTTTTLVPTGIWRWTSEKILDDGYRRPWEVYGWWNPLNGTYNNFSHDGLKACVTVIDPTPGASASSNEYEKNTVDHTINHSVSLGVSTCPAFSTPVTIQARGEDGTVYYDETTNASFGGTTCTWSPTTAKKIPFGTLNEKPPGYTVVYSTILESTGKSSVNSFKVVEVPFARFYGNDVYATSKNPGEGQFRFNDSFNGIVSYDERGSVAQYAAFAAGASTNYLDTAGFRYFAGALPPQPPTGLLSENSIFNDVSATSVYNKVLQSKPNDCLSSLISAIPQDGGNVYGGMSTGTVSVCYDVNNGSNLNVTPLNVNPWQYSNKKITIYHTGNLYITKDYINTTPATDRNNPDKAGVALFVANNIYIDKNVTRVDAVLVANNTIDTCYNTTVTAWGITNSDQVNGSSVANSNLEDPGQCRNKLVINGSVSAKKIKYKRVGGSRYLAPVGSLPGNSYGAGVVEKDGQLNLPQDSGLSAEIINFPAYLYWAQPYLVNESTSGGKVNAIYTAPPRQ